MERPIAWPMTREYKKPRESPLEQRKTVRKRLLPTEREEVKKPKLSKELVKKIADTQEPTSEGYELNQLMSKALENELQDIMIKVWQELPDAPPSAAESLVTDKFRNEAGDDLKNALGLNVTQRILNVSNPLNVKIEFDTQPYGPCAKNFLKWLNCAAMRRVLDGQHNYRALLRSQADFDRVISKGTVKIGSLKAKITPHYTFTKCPPKLKTIYKCSRKTIQEQEKEIKNKQSLDSNKKLDTTATKAEAKTTEVVKTETKNPAQTVKTGAKNPAEATKTEIKKEATKTEIKKAAEVTKTETKKPTEIKKTVNNKPAEVTKTEGKPTVTKPVDKKTTVTKVTPAKPQVTPKKDAQNKSTAQTKPKETKVTEKAKPKTVITNKTTVNKTTLNKVDKKKQRKPSDFDELNDEDILALMSDAIVLDECVGSDED